MKKILILLVLVSISSLLINYYYRNGSTESDKSDNSTEPGTEESTVTTAITPANHETNGIKTEWLQVRLIDNIDLYSNLDEQLTSEELITKYLCQNLISAGFYTKDNKHLGLFATDYNIISKETKSTLLNGYFYIKGGKAFISQSAPVNPRLAVQSGPMLIKDGVPLKLSTQNDSSDRRVAVGVLRDGSVLFLVSYKEGSFFQGPKLADFPGIIATLQSETSLKFTDVLNLDGGTASAFFTERNNVTELSKIGGFFCVDN